MPEPCALCGKPAHYLHLLTSIYLCTECMLLSQEQNPENTLDNYIRIHRDRPRQ